MDALGHMELGQIVDYCIEYNEIHAPEKGEGSKEKKETRRAATQADWDALLG